MTSRLSHLPPPPSGRTGWPWTEETPPRAYAAGIAWPRISIVTPSFNQAAYLEETLRSVLLQNYPNLQYIVMDGGSADGSLEIIERYAPWLDHWESEPDRGQSHAINKGLTHCDGEWFNWLNSDDCLRPGALAALATRAHNDIVMLCGQELMGTDVETAKNMGHTRIGPTLEDALVHHRICQQATFLRTDAVRDLGGVREDLHYVMDLDLVSRVLLRHGPSRAQPVDTVIAFFRLHEQTKTHTVFPRFRLEERSLFLGWAEALHLPENLRQRIATPTSSARLAHDIARFDVLRLTDRLAHRYWWEETIEVAWRERDFKRFKAELLAYQIAFPAADHPRLRTLRRFVGLPVVLLYALSWFRA